MNRNTILKMLLNQGKWQEVSGIPPLTLDKSLGKDLKDYKIYGNSYQKKYSGKNLLNPSDVPSSNVYIRNIDGTTGSTSSGEWRSSDYIEVKPNTTYFFSQINSPAYVAGGAWYNSNKVYISGYSSTQLIGDNNFATSPADAKYLRHSWRIDAGYNTNWENTVMIAESNIEIPYEPYVRGIPSPNSEYPQEIKSVGDKSLNKFNPSGTQEVAAYNAIRFGENGKSYAISLTDKDSTVDISGCYLAVSDGAEYIGHQSSFSYLVTNGTVSLAQRTSRADIDQCYLAVYPSTQATWDKINARFNIMVVEGSTYKDYEPYGYKIPIIVSDGTNSSTTNIYLDEPLRKIGDYADYIDFINQKVYRNVIVNDDSGEQTIENSYSGTTDTTGTTIQLSTISTYKGTTIININTEVPSSNMYVMYKGK